MSFVDDITSMNVPTVDSTMGLICFIVNIFLPGVGTMIAGVKGDHTNSIIIGIIQFILSGFFIGWIWAIFWGYLIYKKASG